MIKNKTLIVERRGCDFWDDCDTQKNSNLENFRLVGKIKSRGNRIYTLEICTTHTENAQRLKNNRRLGIGATYCTINNCYTRADGCTFGDVSKFIICHPTREAVLIAINNTFGTAYTNLEILPNGEYLEK